MRPMSLPKPARFTKHLAMALLLIGSAAQSQAGQISLNPTFNISDQSVWGTTAPSGISHRQGLARLRANGSDPQRPYSFGGTVAGVGVKFGGHIEVDHTFGASVSMNAGSLNATLPYDIRLSFDESTIATDRQLNFDSSFALNPNASFSTTTSLPHLNIHDEWWYEVNGKLEGCVINCSTLTSFNRNHTGYIDRRTLFNLDAGTINVQPPGHAVDSLSVNSSINVTGSVAGNSVSGSNSEFALEMNNFRPVKLIPGVGTASTGGFSGSALGVNIGADWTLLSVEVDTSLRMNQVFKLTPEIPVLLLDFGNGYIISFLAGESVTVDLPAWWTPDLGFIPTVVLDSLLTNTTDIILGFDADLKLPSFKIHGVNCCGSLGSLGLIDTSFTQNLFDEQFALQQQSYTGEPIQLSSVQSVPEPSTLLLLSSGLLGFRLARRARR